MDEEKAILKAERKKGTSTEGVILYYMNGCRFMISIFR